MVRRISSSLPMTGSSFPSRAAVRSRPYFSGIRRFLRVLIGHGLAPTYGIDCGLRVWIGTAWLSSRLPQRESRPAPAAGARWRCSCPHGPLQRLAAIKQAVQATPQIHRLRRRLQRGLLGEMTFDTALEVVGLTPAFKNAAGKTSCSRRASSRWSVPAADVVASGQVLGRSRPRPFRWCSAVGHGSVGAETTVWVIPAHEVWRTDPNGFGLHT